MRRRDAAAGGRGVAHGLRREQRALERFGRRHVGLGRALAHGDADAGAREVDAAAHDLALLDEAVDRRCVGQEDVDRFAALEARDQRAGRGIARADAVAVRALERRQQFVGRRLDRGRDERVDLGGPGRCRSRTSSMMTMASARMTAIPLSRSQCPVAGVSNSRKSVRRHWSQLTTCCGWPKSNAGPIASRTYLE